MGKSTWRLKHGTLRTGKRLKEVVTLGALQLSGQQRTLRMRTLLVGTKNVEEYRRPDNDGGFHREYRYRDLGNINSLI